MAERLVIEVDGGQHGGDDDLRRDQLLASEGFRVLRFWNHDVLQNIDGVLTRIAEVIATARTISPPP